MAELVMMPKLGFNMSAGKLVKWYKSEGQEIKKGEAFFSVETDKTNIDIEATSDTIVRKLLILEGETVEVTLPIAVIGEKEENIERYISEALSKLGKEGETNNEISGEILNNIQSSPKESMISNKIKDQDGMLKISPRARKALEERNIDISQLNIKGTGYQGGICEADILKLDTQVAPSVRISPLAGKIAAVEGIDASTLTGTGAGNKIMKRDVEASIKAAANNQIVDNKDVSKAQYADDGKEILEITPYDGVRRVIGERMAQSKFTAPHLYFTKAVDLSNILELRKQINSTQETKTSVTDYVAMAVIKALQKYPDVNASLHEEKIIKYKTVNLGIAVAAPTGLIVPVIKNAEKKGIINFSKDASKLFEKARGGKLMPSEYSGGTFTISNLGMFGIDNFTAIINQPESAILAVSGTQKTPVVMTNYNGEDEIVIRPIMNITLTVDHRVIDGLLAAQFVGEIKKYLENPAGLILSLEEK